MQNSPRNPERKILKSIDVADIRLNLWRPQPFPEVVPLIMPKDNPPLFVPQFDDMQFTLPDPSRYRVTDVHSDDEVRGFIRIGQNYVLRIGENADYVLFRGRVKQDTVEQGIALPRDARFVLLQAFFNQEVLESEQEKLRQKKLNELQELHKILTKKDIDPYNGKTRLS